MENNTEEKKRFVAQYWGQEVGVLLPRPPSSNSKSIGIEIDEEFLGEIDYLELYSLDSITDEHAIEVAKILGYDDIPMFNQIEEVKEWLDDRFGLGHIKHKWDCLKAFDFLRKNSYAVPFDGKPVPELISLGWVKIKQQ